MPKESIRVTLAATESGAAWYHRIQFEGCLAKKREKWSQHTKTIATLSYKNL